MTKEKSKVVAITTENKTKQENDRSNKSKRRKSSSDPNGSLSIARGNVTTHLIVAETKAILEEQRTEKEWMTIQKHMDGPHAHEAHQRKKILQKMDADPKYSESFTDPQKRALERRQRLPKKSQLFIQKRNLQRLEAAVAATDAQTILSLETPGLVEAEHDLEHTARLTQTQLKRHHLDEQTARHIYDLNLPSYAPYRFHYDRSGRAGLLTGSNSHVALFDQHTQALVTEFHLPGQTIRDACFLHNPSLLAVAQTNHVYIYDNTGAEVHRLDEHHDPFALTYLPHHWLLASLGRTGRLIYQDTSTGQVVSRHASLLGPSSVLRHNPHSAVVHAGHKNGTVTLWSPASSTYLVKILCHKGAAITSLAVDGHTMVTGAADKQVRLWDMRMYKELCSYYCIGGIPTSLDISQRGILGIGHGCHATFWKDCHQKHKEPYMTHSMPACQVSTLRFRPFEDVCGIGHSKGISSIVIPGSGEPNLDSGEYNTNPFSDRIQTREAEVRALLDKLSPEMISLDPDVVATVEANDPHLRREQAEDIRAEIELNAKSKPVKARPTKKRGRSKIQSQLRRRAQKNVIDQATATRLNSSIVQKINVEKQPSEVPTTIAPALKRFF
jgi:U3 small nucleolar RNA-associated protein 7